MKDIFPDIHGQIDKLEPALRQLGYSQKHGAWRHSDPTRTALFLGDYIDRGPQNAEVIRLVRNMLDAGSAQAIMGNHELNAIHFHTKHPESGEPLRAWSAKNQRQHQSFLAEFPVGSAEAKEAIGWMQQLPIFIEFDDLRVVHACWDEEKITSVAKLAPTAVLTEAQIMAVANQSHPLNGLIETLLKGPETKLEAGYNITDKDGTIRHEVRVKWWNALGKTWPDIAMSVPDISELPLGALPQGVLKSIYPPSAKPVIFGHYWLTGKPVLQAKNALCLDYSAGKEGPLMSYQHQAGQALDLEHITQHGV